MSDNTDNADKVGPTPESPDADLDRRAAVRRVATVVGLAAGAMAIPTLTGTAGASPGDAVKAGGGTNAGDAQTSLKAGSTIATLKVENSNVRSGPAGNKVDIVAPQLRLSCPVPSSTRPQVPDLASIKPGDVAAAGGLLYFGADLGTPTAVPAQVHTATFSNFFHPIPAAKSLVISTAKLNAKQRKTFPAGTFDAAGRLVQGKRLGLDLRRWVNTEDLPNSAGVSVSITVNGASASGAVRAHESETSAGEVTVCSFTVLPGALLAGGKPYALPATGGAVLGLDAADKLWISVSTPTHVTVQIVGLVIPDPSAIVEPATPASTMTSPQRRGALQRQAVRDMTSSVNPTK